MQSVQCEPIMVISTRDTKLIPRQSPHIPPRPEMKSNQVIFGDLSNSGRKCVWSFSFNFWLTEWILQFKNIELYFCPDLLCNNILMLSLLSNASVTVSGAYYLSNHWIFALPDMTNINMIYKLWNFGNTSLPSKSNTFLKKITQSTNFPMSFHSMM